MVYGMNFLKVLKFELLHQKIIFGTCYLNTIFNQMRFLNYFSVLVFGAISF
jgi:hypothetical protein